MNLTIREGICFRDLRSQGDTITVKVAPRDFKKMRPLLRKTGCRVHILEKKGGLLLSLAGRRRRSVLLGLILFCGLLYFLASFVWSIGITGNEAVSENEILEVLEKCGVREGISKRQLDLSQLEKVLLLEIEELSWVGAQLRGVFLEIRSLNVKENRLRRGRRLIWLPPRTGWLSYPCFSRGGCRRGW